MVRGKTQVMHKTVAHHTLTNPDPPFPNPDWPPFQVPPLSLMFYRVEYPFGQFR